MGPNKLSKNYSMFLVIQVCAFYININVLLRFVTFSAQYIKIVLNWLASFRKKWFKSGNSWLVLSLHNNIYKNHLFSLFKIWLSSSYLLKAKIIRHKVVRTRLARCRKNSVTCTEPSVKNVRIVPTFLYHPSSKLWLSSWSNCLFCILADLS
jgi:hypothetical protein